MTDVSSENDPSRSADVTFETTQWLRELRKERSKRDISKDIEQRISGEANPIIIAVLESALVGEYGLSGQHGNSENVIQDQIEREPSNPLPLLALAGYRIYQENRPDLAIPLARKAVELADTKIKFRRHARAVLARAAAQMRDTSLMSECLIQISELKLTSKDIDVNKEHDLLEKANKIGVVKEI